MTNEEKLEAIYEMTRENHEILKTIRRQQYLANAGRIFYWLVILGAIGGVYYYVRPIMSLFSSNQAAVEERMSQFGGLPEAKAFSQFIEALRHLRGQD